MQLELGFGLSKFVGPLIFFAFVVVFLLTIFRRVEYGIFFLVPFIPLQNVLNYANIYPLGKDINDLMLFAMLLRWVLDRKKGNLTQRWKGWHKSDDKFFLKSPLNLPIFLLILWTFIELIRGANYLGYGYTVLIGDDRFIAWKNYLMMPTLFFIVYNNIKNPRHMEILIVLMAGAMLTLDRNFYQAAHERDLSHEYTQWRFGGAGGQALGGNALAVFQAQYAIVMLFMFLATKKTWQKFFFGFITLFTYYCLMFSFSRSGYLAGVVTLLFAGFIKERRILLGMALLVIFWQVILPQSVQQRIMMTKSEDGQYDTTMMQRVGMWELAKGIISANPIAGAGFNVSPYLKIHVDGFKYTWASFHSGYMETTVELGFVGITLYILIFSLGAHSGWKLYRLADDEFHRALGLACIGCVLAILSGNAAGTYWNYMNVMGFYWALLGMVLRLTVIYNEQKQSKPAPALNTPVAQDLPVPVKAVAPVKVAAIKSKRRTFTKKAGKSGSRTETLAQQDIIDV